MGSAVSYVTSSLAAIQRKDWFRAVNKKLSLIPKSGTEQNFQQPTDMSYVFGGAYVPLSCRLVNSIRFGEVDFFYTNVLVMLGPFGRKLGYIPRNF